MSKVHRLGSTAPVSKRPVMPHSTRCNMPPAMVTVMEAESCGKVAATRCPDCGRVALSVGLADGREPGDVFLLPADVAAPERIEADMPMAPDREAAGERERELRRTGRWQDDYVSKRARGRDPLDRLRWELVREAA